MTNPFDKDVERLKHDLLESGETPAEAESLAQVAHFLRKMPQLPANPAQQQATLNVLAGHLPRRKTRLERLKEWYPLLLLYSQLRVIQTEIWLASAFVLALGVVVTLTAPHADLLSLSVLAPVVAAVGVALLYDTDVQQMLELEDTTRASARLLLLARLTWVFSFDLIVALVGSIILALLRTEISLVPLIMSWLAPMTFLSAFAFFLSVLMVEPLAGAAFSFVLWFLHLILQSQSAGNALLQLLSMQGLSDPSNRLFLFITAGLLIGVALWWVGHVERGLEPST